MRVCIFILRPRGRVRIHPCNWWAGFVFSSSLTPSHPGTGEGDAIGHIFLRRSKSWPTRRWPAGTGTGSINHARQVGNKKSHCYCKPESAAKGLSALLIRELWPQVILHLQGSKSSISIPSVLTPSASSRELEEGWVRVGRGRRQDTAPSIGGDRSERHHHIDRSLLSAIIISDYSQLPIQR
jgi:hypothetical protein